MPIHKYVSLLSDILSGIYEQPKPPEFLPAI